MTIQSLAARGQSNRAIARLLGVHENAIRYHRRRQAAGETDGRARQVHRAAEVAGAIEHWLTQRDDREPLNLAALYDYLVAEHDYPGSVRSLQRYFKAHYPQPPIRARRRVETPPGAQAQADWGDFPGVRVGGHKLTLHLFVLKLSWSRFPACIWSVRQDQLAWHYVHNEALRRLGGVPAVIRIDNLKTGVIHGAGPWGVINHHYRSYARSVGFHIDPCLPRHPQGKGKGERLVRDVRGQVSPYGRDWDDVPALQRHSDDRIATLATRRLCAATGRTVADSLTLERCHLANLPILPEPFDLARTRTVAVDATIGFEGRRYSVPFAFVGQRVEVRGAAGRVQVLAKDGVIAVHPRHTPELILIDPRHYEGPSTPQVAAPMPLGRMGRKLEEIRALKPEQRPLDLYAALAEVAR